MNYKNLKSLGMRIIYNIVENQLDGEIEYFNDEGTRCEIQFRNNSSDRKN